MALRCRKCGTTYPDEYETEWGKGTIGDGDGPEPRCTALLEARGAPRAQDGSLPLERCGGRLFDAGDVEVTWKAPKSAEEHILRVRRERQAATTQRTTPTTVTRVQ